MFLVFVCLILGAAAQFPVINQGPANLTNGVGSTVTFTCEGEGNPTPNIMIVKEDSITDFNVYNNGVRTPGSQSKVSVVRTISNLAFSDAGWYVCLVSNQHGVVVSRAHLDVKEDPCSKVGCPKRKFCHPDYTTMTTECRCKPCEDRTYKPVCASDCQTYYNSCMMREHSCDNNLYLTVSNKGECRTEELELTVSSSKVELREGETLSLTCSYTGHPAPTVTRWIKSKNNGRQRAVSTESEYIVQAVGERDAGIYKCIAQQCNNKIQSSKVEVIVHPKEQNAVDEPVPETKVCKIFGDPHIMSFDGRTYDFMGRCDYVIAMDCSMNTWMLLGSFRPCGNGVTCLEQMTFYHGQMAPLIITRGWIVQQNGEKFRLRKNKPTEVDELILTYTGLSIEITLPSGVRMVYDGFWGIQIITTPEMETCGLCGNNNGDAGDDLAQGRFGPTGNDINKYGTSWGLRYNWCGIEEPTGEVTCENQAEVEQQCDNILQSEAFSECAALINTDFYRDSCLTDGCATKVERYDGPTHCVYANTLAQHCQVAGYKVPKDFLQLVGCGTKREFQAAVYNSGCPLAGNPPFLDAK